MRSCGFFAPRLLGVTCRSGTVRGRRCTSGPGPGGPKDCSTGSQNASKSIWTPRGRSAGSLVCGGLVCPGQPCGRRRRQKGGHEEPEDRALGRLRGGYGSKLHVVTDGQGLPLAAEVTPGQRHESACSETLMNAVRIPQESGPAQVSPGLYLIRRYLRVLDVSDTA